METAIKPIETIYNGYRFRSRLEARWAVFLDCLGVKYEYEPEGFELPDGTRYLPDFRVMCHATRGGDCEPFPLYIEVKGQMDEASARKIKTFSFCEAWKDFDWPEPNDPDGEKKKQAYREKFARSHFSLLIVGDIPNIMHVEDIYNSFVMGCYDSLGFDLCPFNYETIDGDYFGAYPSVEHGRFGLLGDEGSYVGWGDPFLTAYSYLAARQARFEHGESPQLVPKDYRGRLKLLEAQDLFGAIAR